MGGDAGGQAATAEAIQCFVKKKWNFNFRNMLVVITER